MFRCFSSSSLFLAVIFCTFMSVASLHLALKKNFYYLVVTLLEKTCVQRRSSRFVSVIWSVLGDQIENDEVGGWCGTLCVCVCVCVGRDSEMLTGIWCSNLLGKRPLGRTKNRWKNSYNKSQRDTLFIKFILIKNSTCFGQIYCPSSGISQYCIHSNRYLSCWDFKGF